MYLLKFFVSFLRPKIDVSLKVAYKFSHTLDLAILDLELIISFIES